MKFKGMERIVQRNLGFLKGSHKNNFPCLGVDPSRLAALLVLSIRGVCAVLASYQTGVSSPKHGKLFSREPLCDLTRRVIPTLGCSVGVSNASDEP